MAGTNLRRRRWERTPHVYQDLPHSHGTGGLCREFQLVCIATKPHALQPVNEHVLIADEDEFPCVRTTDRTPSPYQLHISADSDPQFVWQCCVLLCTTCRNSPLARKSLDLTGGSEMPRDCAISLVDNSPDCCSSSTLRDAGLSRCIAPLRMLALCCRA